jgi:hypothetical protein
VVELNSGKQQLYQVGVCLFGGHFVSYGGPQQNLRQLGTQRDLLEAPPVFAGVAQQVLVRAEPVPRFAFVFELRSEHVDHLDLSDGEEQRK